MWTKRLKKAFSDNLAKWREWRTAGLLRVYVGVCAGSRSVGSLRKSWIDTVKECLKNRGLDVRQERRMVQDRTEWRGFVRGNAWGIAWWMNP